MLADKVKKNHTQPRLLHEIITSPADSVADENSKKRIETQEDKQVEKCQF